MIRATFRRMPIVFVCFVVVGCHAVARVTSFVPSVAFARSTEPMMTFLWPPRRARSTLSLSTEVAADDRAGKHHFFADRLSRYLHQPRSGYPLTGSTLRGKTRALPLCRLFAAMRSRINCLQKQSGGLPLGIDGRCLETLSRDENHSSNTLAQSERNCNGVSKVTAFPEEEDIPALQVHYCREPSSTMPCTCTTTPQQGHVWRILLKSLRLTHNFLLLHDNVSAPFLEHCKLVP